ncbi:hypothetical protein ARMSODRAFT_675713 [Armillaria solidipes]|uniref:Uncharacterized protein n=1 Tax=Armillaria solidipes TaxID=1076256 RepID=A0A2H3BAV4_9AGAR|nr:hypothetical protein ARMSODRAFT_675713 [Armillaria solidipes]
MSAVLACSNCSQRLWEELGKAERSRAEPSGGNTTNRCKPCATVASRGLPHFFQNSRPRWFSCSAFAFQYFMLSILSAIRTRLPRSPDRIILSSMISRSLTGTCWKGIFKTFIALCDPGISLVMVLKRSHSMPFEEMLRTYQANWLSVCNLICHYSSAVIECFSRWTDALCKSRATQPGWCRNTLKDRRFSRFSTCCSFTSMNDVRRARALAHAQGRQDPLLPILWSGPLVFFRAG